MDLNTIVDEILVAITERNKKKILYLFEVAEQQGYTRSKEFIDITDLIPEEWRNELKIVSIYEFNLNGEVFTVPLLPREIRRIAEALRKGVSSEHILKAFRIKQTLGGEILYSEEL